MTTTTSLINRHAVAAYFVVTFAISWGGFMLVGGPGLFAGSNWQSDARFMPAVMAMLAGPPITGLVLTGLISGVKGPRDLLQRLLRWRISARWYALAILSAPLLMLVTVFALSLVSFDFRPAIGRTDDKVGLVVAGIAVGLVGGLVEEIGWTGFAIPRLRLSHGIFSTALIVGVLWGAWHLLQMSWVGASSSESVPRILFLLQYFASAIATLTGYRVLMVWVYDRTGSLLVAVLMHASYIFTTLFVLALPTTGIGFLASAWAWCAVLWFVVAIVALTDRAHFARHPLRWRVA